MESIDPFSLLDQMAAEQPLDPREEILRGRLIARLLLVYSIADPKRCELYLAETRTIPVTHLHAALVAIVRSRVYSTLPTIGEIWTAAREIAGMNREQYGAGRYLPAPREWPPDGKRHAIEPGQFETLPEPESYPRMLLEAGRRALLPT